MVFFFAVEEVARREIVIGLGSITGSIIYLLLRLRPWAKRKMRKKNNWTSALFLPSIVWAYLFKLWMDCW